MVAALHSLDFVHLDIKPDNILLSRIKGPGGADVYKLGDFGLATRADGSWPIDEGDRRYCSTELMAGERSALRAADIFSLGLTVWELASHVELPNDGDTYLALRRSKLPPLPGYSQPFQELVQVRCAQLLQLCLLVARAFGCRRMYMYRTGTDRWQQGRAGPHTDAL